MILHGLVNRVAGPEFVVHEPVRPKFSGPVVLRLVMMNRPGVRKKDGAFR